jgi:hypothetical protein
MVSSHAWGCHQLPAWIILSLHRISQTLKAEIEQRRLPWALHQKAFDNDSTCICYCSNLYHVSFDHSRESIAKPWKTRLGSENFSTYEKITNGPKVQTADKKTVMHVVGKETVFITHEVETDSGEISTRSGVLHPVYHIPGLSARLLLLRFFPLVSLLLYPFHP